MKQKLNIALLISLIFPSIVACGNVAPPANNVSVLPKDCRTTVNEHLPLTLDGLIPPNAMILWETSAGSIISTPPGLNALFIAPAQPIVAIISISISSGTPSLQIPITYQCIVTDETGAFSQTMIENSTDHEPTIIISEVMANPCGDIEVKKWNEYVELYNFGDELIDISGWWLMDLGERGTPDQLVAWAQRNPTTPLPGNLVLDSTLIPAGGFALILSPMYGDGLYPYTMPYTIPANTIILTVANSRSLGDDLSSIVGNGPGRDVLVLYKGGPSVIQEIISTYGTPKLGPYVSDIQDDYLDNLPLDLHECTSAERMIATGADATGNWREISNGSPGEAPYP